MMSERLERGLSARVECAIERAVKEQYPNPECSSWKELKPADISRDIARHLDRIKQSLGIPAQLLEQDPEHVNYANARRNYG